MPPDAIVPTHVLQVRAGLPEVKTDMLAAEEPLEIRLVHGPATARQQHAISVTMRTPGHDFELAAGFLFTEGIVRSAADIRKVSYCEGLSGNVVRVSLKGDVSVDSTQLTRHFYTTSSCGVCGKASIDAVYTTRRIRPDKSADWAFSAEQLLTLPHRLREAQVLFNQTGSLHGCALFDASGTLLMVREDVGRHNAVDKLIGAALQQDLLPLTQYGLLLSGRISFELVQKAWMSGITLIAAVGAPSSLAVQLATESGMTLVGFLRGSGFNVYSGKERIVISTHENPH
ncbi:MAG: formate dehydrogenase accessory sulfurtransferase FdhD [Sphingobacteriales bacterium]|nr:MAG: formate dehydrogenase accessory sulfurtransferase FdhD [Sphingobacteriales bacterium]